MVAIFPEGSLSLFAGPLAGGKGCFTAIFKTALNLMGDWCSKG